MRPWIALVLALSLGACGGAARAPATPSAAPEKPAVAAAPATAALPLPDHSLRRSAVREVVSQGLGMFLRRVDLDDHPVRLDGKFRGFRIAALHDTQFWGGVDLKAGDVVTSVNGFPIEHPEQAQTAFDSLQVASELRVAYDRDGQAREIVYAIIDDK
jgi:type II secretory pathway component PulC